MNMPQVGINRRAWRAKLNSLGCGLGSALLALAALELGRYAHFVLALRMFVNPWSAATGIPPSPLLTHPYVAALLAVSCGTSLGVFAWPRLQTRFGVRLAVLAAGGAIGGAALLVYADAAARLRDPMGTPVGWPQLWLGVALLSAPSCAALAAARMAARSGLRPTRWLTPVLLCLPLLVAGYAVLQHALALLALEQQARATWTLGGLRLQAAPLADALMAARPYVVLALVPLLLSAARSRGELSADRNAGYAGVACALLGALALLCVQPFVLDGRAPPPPALTDHSADSPPAPWREVPRPTECDAQEWAPELDPVRGVIDGRHVTPHQFQEDLKTLKLNWHILNPGRPFPALLRITGEIPAARRVAEDAGYLQAALAAGYQEIELEAHYWEIYESHTLGSLRAWRRTCGPRYLLVPAPVDTRLRWRQAQLQPKQSPLPVGDPEP